MNLSSSVLSFRRAGLCLNLGIAYTPSAHTAPTSILPGPDTQKLKLIEITWHALDDMPKDQQVICSLILTAPNTTSFNCVIFGHNSHNHLKWGRISHRRTEWRESRKKQRSSRMYSPS